MGLMSKDPVNGWTKKERAPKANAKIPLRASSHQLLMRTLSIEIPSKSFKPVVNVRRLL
jgi:hypothetical protein